MYILFVKMFNILVSLAATFANVIYTTHASGEQHIHVSSRYLIFIYMYMYI